MFSAAVLAAMSPPEEVFCSGWKYAYSGRERFSHRLLLEASGEVAGPRFVEFPGAKEYIAKPLARRGAVTAMERVKPKNEEGAPSYGSDEELGAEEERMTRVAKPWVAIATSSSTDAFAAKVAPSELDARETAVSTCGADCTVLVAAPYGECLAVIRAPLPGGRIGSFGGRGATTSEAEGIALSACKGAKASACPVVLSQCMK